MEDPKYTIQCTYSEVIAIGQMRASSKEARHMMSYFWLAMGLTAALVFILSRIFHGTPIPFFGLLPTVAYFIVQYRANKKVKEESLKFAEGIKAQGKM